MEHQPCRYTPNSCPIVNTNVDGQHQQNSNRLTSADSVATNLVVAGPKHYFVDNSGEHEDS